MAYIELYNNELLDLVNLGKTLKDFNETRGDYMKVQIFKGASEKVIGTLYSNRLLLTYSEADNYYMGDYHFHNEDPSMGFCTGRFHSHNSISNLLPVLVGTSLNEPLNSSTIFKKQIDIFKDDSEGIYLKPNEILRLLSLPKDRYRLRIFFLRNIKSTLGIFLNQNKNNLIENGNFFAGLEATQTGDLDRSSGKNNFMRINNPGFSPYILEQNGLAGNKYSMRVTGIESNSSYVFSCWAAWDENFDGGTAIASFSDVTADQDPTLGLPTVPNTTVGGSYLNDDGSENFDRILNTKELGGLTWYKLYSFVRTDENANLGSILIHVGNNVGATFKPSMSPLGRRFFTDLRFGKVGSLVGSDVSDYLNKLKVEIDIGNIFKSIDVTKRTIPSTELKLPEAHTITADDYEKLVMEAAVKSATEAASVEDILAKFQSDSGEITVDIDPTAQTQKKSTTTVKKVSKRRRRISFRKKLKRRAKSWGKPSRGRGRARTSKGRGGLRRSRTTRKRSRGRRRGRRR